MTSRLTASFSCRFPSFDVLRSWWGRDLDEALAAFEPERRQRLYEEVRHAVHRFEGLTGIVAPAELLLGSGTK